MSLYNEWTELVVDFVQTKGEKAFWAEYSAVEERIYRKVLANANETLKFKISSFGEEMDTTPQFIMGFLDGINESLTETLDLESMDENSDVEMNID